MTREETIQRLIELGIANPVNAEGRIVLAGADLTGVDLSNAWLCGADLTHTTLKRASLEASNLARADLTEAVLTDAILTEALLTGTIGLSSSTEAAAELLRQAAGPDRDKLELAGLVWIFRGYCWEYWKTFPHPLRDWAIETLSAYPAWGFRDVFAGWE